MRFGTSSLAILVLGALTWSGIPQPSHEHSSVAPPLFASDTSAPQKDTKPKERHRGTMPKCPEGGERVPNEKRSPYDSIAPLSPLVA